MCAEVSLHTHSTFKLGLLMWTGHSGECRQTRDDELSMQMISDCGKCFGENQAKKYRKWPGPGFVCDYSRRPLGNLSSVFSSMHHPDCSGLHALPATDLLMPWLTWCLGRGVVCYLRTWSVLIFTTGMRRFRFCGQVNTAAAEETDLYHGRCWCAVYNNGMCWR